VAGAALATLVLLTPSTAGAQPSSGERAFQRCYACHSLLAGEDKLPGPNLRTVMGRRAGSLPGFEFSDAMIAAGTRGLVWDRRSLEAFIADPEAMVPGTSMTAHLPDAEARHQVIDYLERGR
jgi:cytochrome c